MDALSATEVALCIRQAQAGDAQALGTLLEQYRPYLHLLAELHIDRRLGGKADASDLVQETCLDAGRDFGHFRGAQERELVAWLREVLADNLADLLRRQRGAQSRDVTRERRLVDELNTSLANGLVGTGTSPSQHASRREQAVLVAGALARLPKDYARVLVLRHLEGLSYVEIADRMGRTAEAVKKLWARALVMLRGCFEVAP